MNKNTQKPLQFARGKSQLKTKEKRQKLYSTAFIQPYQHHKKECEIKWDLSREKILLLFLVSPAIINELRRSHTLSPYLRAHYLRY